MPEIGLALVHGLRHHDYRGRVVLTAHSPRAVEQLSVADVDAVLEPYPLAAATAAEVVDQLLRPSQDEAEGESRPS